jgi:hypothetical protein
MKRKKNDDENEKEKLNYRSNPKEVDAKSKTK